MLLAATVLIVIILCVTIFLVLRLSRISNQISQLEAHSRQSSSFQSVGDQIKKSFKAQNKKIEKQDRRRARYLAQRIVRAQIECHTIYLRVENEVAEEPEEDTARKEMVEAHWERELMPRLEELIEVAKLYVDKDELLLSAAEEFLEKNQSDPEPPGPPRSMDQAKELFLKEVKEVKQRGGEAGLANPFGAAHSEAQDLAYWAAVLTYKLNTRTEQERNEILSKPKQE